VHATRASVVLLGLLTAVLPGQVRAETELAVSAGYTWTRPANVRVSQPSTDSDATFGDVHWESRALRMPIYYGLRATHWLTSQPQLGLGAEFVHYKVYAEVQRSVSVRGRWNGSPVDTTAPMGDRVQNFSISHGVNYVAANVLYRWRADGAARPVGALVPYVGGGPVLYVLHPESMVNGLAQDGPYQTSGLGAHAFAGLNYSLGAHTGVFTEMKFDAGRARGDVAGGGRFGTNLRTLQIAVGFAYGF
jgi:lipid A oxidase